jgi:hypothetical protein
MVDRAEAFAEPRDGRLVGEVDGYDSDAGLTDVCAGQGVLVATAGDEAGARVAAARHQGEVVGARCLG